MPHIQSVVIAGGGLTGLTLALALKQGAGERLAVTVVDPSIEAMTRDGRASSLAAGTQRMLDVLGVWQDLAPRAQPIRDMVITDSSLAEPLRPPLLGFKGDDPANPFAYMIENAHLARSVLDRSRRAGVAFVTGRIDRWTVRADGARAAGRARLGDGRALDAALLVAADGARSKLREQAGIGWIGWSYPQAGLVATIGHSREHGGRAVQHFLPSGPFAILPLQGRRSSIVWTERADNVEALLALDEEDQLAEIEQRFGLTLGELALESPIRSHPLTFGIARRFIGDRLALVGDAAHVVHPVAGQGLNIGLRDAAMLAQEVTDAMRLGLDPGDTTALTAYERSRRADVMAMGLVTDGLTRLFSNDVLPVRLVRDLGLGLVDRIPALKQAFIREAAGTGPGRPRLMRGKPL